jgi:hypothetical protein
LGCGVGVLRELVWEQGASLVLLLEDLLLEVLHVLETELGVVLLVVLWQIEVVVHVVKVVIFVVGVLGRLLLSLAQLLIQFGGVLRGKGVLLLVLFGHSPVVVFTLLGLIFVAAVLVERPISSV